MIGLIEVEQAIRWTGRGRNPSRRILASGNGRSASTASRLATDLVMGAGYGRHDRFRIRVLTKSLATIMACESEADQDLVLLAPRKNFAQPGALAIASSGSWNSPLVLTAMEYVNSIGCRT